MSWRCGERGKQTAKREGFCFCFVSFSNCCLFLDNSKLWSWITIRQTFVLSPGRANHWSAIIGASHSKNYVLWEYGGYASDGVKQVAELGSPVKMEEEIRQKVSIFSKKGVDTQKVKGLHISAVVCVYSILWDIYILVISNYFFPLRASCACAAEALFTKDSFNLSGHL